MPESEFPPVEGGGSLLLAWQIRGKNVLVVGGGNVAAGRILGVLNADAKVTVVAPLSGCIPEVKYRISEGQVTHVDRNFLPSDLENVDMVLTAVDDPVASTEIYTLCKQQRIAVNVADVPPECDFYFGSIHRDGPLQIMVSTNGNGPKLANIVRRQIAETLPANLGFAITQVGILRKKLRAIAPEPKQGPKRMDWMSRVCEQWSLQDLCSLTDNVMDDLLSYYEANEVPSLAKLTGTEVESAGLLGWFSVGIHRWYQLLQSFVSPVKP